MQIKMKTNSKLEILTRSKSRDQLLAYATKVSLTVASFLGIFVPRGSFFTIILKGDMLAQNCSQGLPLKFQAGTFGAIKIFRKKISPEVLADVLAEI